MVAAEKYIVCLAALGVVDAVSRGGCGGGDGHELSPCIDLRRRFATEPRSGECLTGSLGASLDRIQRKSQEPEFQAGCQILFESG